MLRTLSVTLLCLVAAACTSIQSGEPTYGTRFGDVEFHIELPPVVEASSDPHAFAFKAWLLEPYAWNELGGQEGFADLTAAIAGGAPLATSELNDYTRKLDGKAYRTFRTTQAIEEVPLAPMHLVMRRGNVLRAERFNPLKLVPARLDVEF